MATLVLCPFNSHGVRVWNFYQSRIRTVSIYFLDPICYAPSANRPRNIFNRTNTNASMNRELRSAVGRTPRPRKYNLFSAAAVFVHLADRATQHPKEYWYALVFYELRLLFLEAPYFILVTQMSHVVDRWQINWQINKVFDGASK